ncbi:MAG TPA: hypothetical protein VF331_06635 [Polyangiales bacterium]
MARRLLGVVLIVCGGSMFGNTLEQLIGLDLGKPSGSGTIVVLGFFAAITLGGVRLLWTKAKAAAKPHPGDAT